MVPYQEKTKRAKENKNYKTAREMYRCPTFFNQYNELPLTLSTFREMISLPEYCLVYPLEDRFETE